MVRLIARIVPRIQERDEGQRGEFGRTIAANPCGEATTSMSGHDNSLAARALDQEARWDCGATRFGPMRP